VDVAQGGLDPFTDAADAADIGGLADGGDAAADADDAGDGCGIGGESFSQSTNVLLASGVGIAISALHVGDKVLATNTKTGKTQAEMVAAVLVHHDTDRYNLAVTEHGKTSVIHTTANHLFWVPYLDKWVHTNKLLKNERLKAPNGATVTVAGGTVPKQRDGWMWDLTVPGNNDHDFYVAVATTAVLVHNCPTSDSGLEQTLHGAERSADPSRLDPAAQADVIANPSQTLSQADGAQVYVQQVGDRYNAVVQGERGVITNLKSISAKSFTRLARNYGWTPN